MSLFQGNEEILKVVVLQLKLCCASFCAQFWGLLIPVDEQRRPQRDETSLGTLLDFPCLIIYTKKFLDCDWLREMQFFGNTVQKKGNLLQKRGKVTNEAF